MTLNKRHKKNGASLNVISRKKNTKIYDYAKEHQATELLSRTKLIEHTNHIQEFYTQMNMGHSHALFESIVVVEKNSSSTNKTQQKAIT